jgi:hypothetical protein
MPEPTPPQRVVKDAIHDPTRTPHDNVINQGCSCRRHCVAIMAAKREWAILGRCNGLCCWLLQQKFGWHGRRREFVHVLGGL